VRTVSHSGGLAFEGFTFVPFHHPSEGTGTGRLLVTAVRVDNVSGGPLADVEVASLLNFHLGGEGVYDGETVTWDAEAGAACEGRGERRMVYQNLVKAGMTVTADGGGQPHNPYGLLAGGAPFAGYVEAGPEDDVVVGFANAVSDAEPLAPGDVRWLGVVSGYAKGAPCAEVAAEVSGFVAGRGPAEIVAAELAWWEDWHAPESPPADLDAEALAVYRQSTAVLKMGQIRETPASGCPSGKCAGQILASLVPGQWNISWVRDASYAIVGLVRAGHLDEARDGLLFMLGAQMRTEGSANYHQKHFIEGADPAPGVWGLGVPLSANYAISVTRYFGRGLEESDANAQGPNIEWDNWGLFLWAFAEYVEASGDAAFLGAAWSKVATQVADLLTELIDPDLGLLVPDSSIWERHWCPHGQCPEPETRKHFTYSSVMAAVGLVRAAALAEVVGDGARAVDYAAAAETLRAAIHATLVAVPPNTGEPALAGNLEEMPFETYYLDVSVVEAIAGGVVHPGSRLAFGTFAALDAWLRIGPHSPGYFRTDDPTWYDGQEWVVVDLRAASALARMGQRGRARTLFEWVRSQATHNYGLIGELYSDGVYQPGSEDERWMAGSDLGGSYQGAVPMCGFGPGAFILAAHDLFGEP
jgi:GH15 family glucan-1,4-alpha-glucosidase